MNTEFLFADRQLTLIRYPEKHQHVSLQAWDSADELVIEHVESALSEGALSEADNPKLMFFNDDFGTLGCWFAHLNPWWVSDSYIAYRSLLENLAANSLSPSVDGNTIQAPLNTLTSVDSL